MRVLLLHAFPYDERMWEPQHDVLAGWDWMAPSLYELPGASVEEWARALLERVPDEIVAVGASMGGYLALELARQAPERVCGLLLAGSRAGADSPERRAFRDETIRTLREQGVDAWNPDAAPGYGADDFVRATQALRDRADASDVVASFAGPFVLVVGEHDELLGVDEARAIVETAPDGRLEVVPGAGHIVGLDQPGRFNEILREFLSTWT
ncbi:MAG TPA: alpha/beta hydrolase [Gaiellaceae bacterium]|nr:alpha/beta hydrolase [Gaiellaceae bacterium]